MSQCQNGKKTAKPKWLRRSLPTGPEYEHIRQLLKSHDLTTVCQEAQCPNQFECYSKGTATFMILGNICTRSCGFCNVATGRPEEADPFEPARVARSVELMGVKHCVITSVDRDDMPDGGANIWAKTIRSVRRRSPQTKLETLIPDFKGEWQNLAIVTAERPEVLSHNLETVRRLSKQVRVQAKYDRSLEVLFRAKKEGLRTKSGIMLGLGETEKEVLETLDDLRSVNCDVATIGQYLQPSKEHLSITEFVHPDRFAFFKEEGLKRGFRFVESGPLVRSSYHAEKHVL